MSQSPRLPSFEHHAIGGIGLPPPRPSTLATGLLRAMALLLAAFLPSSPLRAQDEPVIKSIELRGLERLSQGEILTRMKIKVGQPYREEELDEEYLRLYQSGEFLWIDDAQVIVEADGVRIIIPFEEKERIAKVRLRGIRGLDKNSVKSKLRTRDGGLLNPTDTQLDEQEIVQLYRKKGFLFAEVESDPQPSPAGVIVTFRAKEGPRATVASVRFEGNAAFRDSALTKLMVTRPRSWFLGFPNTGIFEEEAYLEDLRNIRTFYRSKGYFEVIVAAEDMAFNRKGSKIYLGIRIVEGPRFEISSVDLEITGDGVFPKTVLREKLEVSAGDDFDRDAIVADMTRLERLYLDKAYIDARAEYRYEVPEAGNQVALIYNIVEGQKIYIEDIEIRGNVETRDKVIRRELTFYPGEEMNFSRLADSQSNLYRLGYFERPIDLKYEQGSTPSQRHVIVDLKEASTGRLIFGFGVTSGQGLIGNFAINKRNFDITDLPTSVSDIPDAFTGGGQSLLLEIAPGTEFSRARLDFLEPHLLDTNTSLSLRAFKFVNLRSDYDEDRTGGEIAVGHRFLRDKSLRAELAYSYELIDIHDIDPFASPDVFRAQGNTRKSALRLETGYDRRVFRPILGPVDGWNVSSSYEYSGGFLGADLDLSKASLSFSAYETIFSDGDRHRHILALKNSFAWAEEHHNTPEVPIYERYFLGGARSLRGFRFRGVGPHFFKDPLGGNVRHYGTLEYTFPLVEDFFRGVAFVDYGNLDTDLDAYEFSNYRFAIGAGVLLNIRFFGQNLPISLTWGEALAKEDEDRTRNFLFDIGFGF